MNGVTICFTAFHPIITLGTGYTLNHEFILLHACSLNTSLLNSRYRTYYTATK